MQLWPRTAMLWLLCTMLLGACTTAVSQSSSDTRRTPTPTAPTEFVFAEGTRVAGIAVGGMDRATASETLHAELAVLERPLLLLAADKRRTLYPSEIDLHLPVDALLTEAQGQPADAEPVQVRLQVGFDRSALRDELTAFADEIYVAPAADLHIITSTESLSRSFAYEQGRVLDVDAALEAVTERLRAPQQSRRLRLPLQAAPDDRHAGFDRIEAQVAAMAEEWDGVVGFYLYDLQSGATVTRNADTVFSGASVLKVPIMLYAYVSLPEFDEEQARELRQAIVASDNLSANYMLAAAVGGLGTDDALEGAVQMNAMLQDLGLQHTYQNMPYEAGDYLIGVLGLEIPRGPAQEGPPPYTEADPTIRTTPAEISRIFVWIDQCSRGEGTLLERYAETLTPGRCQEMLDLLALNQDSARMVSGVPANTRVEHKSGWVEDMQADVGIVRSPGGDFVLAVYLYQEQPVSWLKDSIAAPVIGDFTRMVYTAYNPVSVP